ncbi:MAG: hypothetical protein AAF224_08030 [Pseudomonadota bacterium]
MGVIRIILFLLGALIVAIAGFAVYLGALKSVTVERSQFGPVSFVYGTHTGPYSKLSESWTAFLETAATRGVDTCHSLAVYLDPPGAPDDQKRTLLGCRIDAMDESMKTAPLATMPSFELPASEALTSTFPFKNVASFWVGPMKVYPEMTKELDAAGVAPSISVELYGHVDVNGVAGEFSEIGFVMPLDADPAMVAALKAAFAD